MDLLPGAVQIHTGNTDRVAVDLKGIIKFFTDGRVEKHAFGVSPSLLLLGIPEVGVELVKVSRVDLFGAVAPSHGLFVELTVEDDTSFWRSERDVRAHDGQHRQIFGRALSVPLKLNGVDLKFILFPVVEIFHELFEQVGHLFRVSEKVLEACGAVLLVWEP